MPKKSSKKTNPLSKRVYVQFTDEEAFELASHAKTNVRMKVSRYVRALTLADMRGDPSLKPRRKPVRREDEITARLIAIHAELRRIGNNTNQLAHQANAKIVPITRDEVLLFLARHEELFDPMF